MIPSFIEAFLKAKPALVEFFAKDHPGGYKEILVETLRHMPELPHFGRPDPDRVHEIDDGDYQGTLVYVIGVTGYQPCDYFYTKVSYGSCSVCDTLQAICGYSNKSPTWQQIEDYITLALHMIEAMHPMSEQMA